MWYFYQNDLIFTRINHIPLASPASTLVFFSEEFLTSSESATSPLVSQETDVISIMTSVFKKFIPRKLAYPLQISGWKITFLSTWPHFSAHVSFRGCSRFFVWSRFLQKIWIFVCFDQSWGNPNLDQKTCSENEKNGFLPICFFWLQASAKIWSQFWNPEKSKETL